MKKDASLSLFKSVILGMENWISQNGLSDQFLLVSIFLLGMCTSRKNWSEHHCKCLYSCGIKQFLSFFALEIAMNKISRHSQGCLSLKWFDYVAGRASFNCKLSRPSWKLLLFAHWQKNLEHIFGLIQSNLICFTMPSGSYQEPDGFSIWSRQFSTSPPPPMSIL